MQRGADTPLGARIALWGGREVMGLLLVSLLAGTATMLYAAYHFHRLSPYGVLANLLAMPVLSVWAMPAGIVGVLTMPFGFDGPFWRLMGEGIGWVIAVAAWVAGLPGAVGRVPAFGTEVLLLGTAGIVVLCLLRTPLRLAGALLIGVTIVMALRTPQPDALVSADGRAFAIRTAGGRLAMVRAGYDTFAFREWLAADGDTRSEKDRSLSQGIACDRVGCVGRLADGTVIAMARTVEAFDEDCRRAALIFSPRDALPGCAATVVDQRVLRRHGAVAIHRAGTALILVPARPDGYDRPWARALPAPDAVAAATRSPRTRTRDATPGRDDLDADDQ